MAIGSLKDLYIDELACLYDAETQMIRTLPRLAEAAHAPELREALVKHCEESRLHLERLELIFTHWGERRRSRPCAGVAGIIQEADGRLNEDATDDVRDAAIIGVAQRIEHYEIAMYGCARTYANRLNRPDEARLLQETLEEEGRTDHRLSEIAEAHVNDDARTEADLAETPKPTGRLRFVPAVSASNGHGAHERLPVLSDADEELGTFDGVIIDTVSQQPRYAIVDSGGLFIHRRYLLPFDDVEFDAEKQTLRVYVGKDIASRYPSFDPDEFGKMGDSELRRYEARLLRLFPRDSVPRTARSTRPTPPEWIMTGAWITVPPEQTDRLTDDTRPFANEFRPAASDVRAANEVAINAPAHRAVEMRSRERVRARRADSARPLSREETPLPPHGDKLR
jgi:ferritin-like metal-binding protein YciE